MTLKQINSATWIDDDPIPEGGSRAWPVSFFDTDGSPVTPKPDSIKWTVTDNEGIEINARRDQPVESAETIQIGVSGSDCMVLAGEGDNIVTRVLTIRYEYDSVDLGADQSGSVELIFQVKNFVGIPSEG